MVSATGSNFTGVALISTVPKLDDESPEEYRRRLRELPVEREEIHEIIGYDA